MGTNIGWHTRLRSDPNVKLVGGSFGGAVDQDTVERLVRSHMAEVKVLPSGTPVFVDRSGREVYLYISVDPRATAMGKAAIEAHRAERRRLEQLAEERREQEQAELDDAMEGLSHEEIIRRLKGA